MDGNVRTQRKKPVRPIQEPPDPYSDEKEEHCVPYSACKCNNKLEALEYISMLPESYILRALESIMTFK